VQRTQAADVYQQMNMMVTSHWVPQAKGVPSQADSLAASGPPGSGQAKLLK
jgi:hypothetical protein